MKTSPPLKTFSSHSAHESSALRLSSSTRVLGRFALFLVGAAAVLATPITINFDSVDASAGPVDATAYLASYGITLSGVSPAAPGIFSDQAFYGSGVVAASSSHNFLLQQSAVFGGSFTLNFAAPLSALEFTRIRNLASNLVGTWTATAYSGATVVSQASEGFGGGSHTSAHYSFSGTNITSLTVSGSGFGVAGISSAMIDDLVLTPMGAVSPPPALLGTWTTTAPLSTPRSQCCAIRLLDGRVLVAGGVDVPPSGPVALASAEIFNPSTNSWTPTGAMLSPRWAFAATLLADGRVLVSGGYNIESGSNPISAAEVWDPATGHWTSTGPMTSVRGGHTVALLANGKVLAAGGYPYILNSAEVYDPATNAWTATASMSRSRAFFTTHLLANGKVLAAEGIGGFGSSELYSPATGTWASTGGLSVGRYAHASAMLLNGTVLIAGGLTSTNTGDETTDSDRYNPSTGTWSATGPLQSPRRGHSMTLLQDGTVLAAGGEHSGVNLNSAELFDPATSTWSFTGAMNIARLAAPAVLLPNGKVLVVGGDGTNSPLASAELYTPYLVNGDTTPPALTVPANQTIEATSANGAVAHFAASATDDSGSVSITYSQNTGTVFPIGATAVIVTATDPAGNISSGTFTITVCDTTPPVITSVSPSIATLSPANHKMVAITVNATATDAVRVASLQIVAVASNEADNGLGDGDTPNDVQITGDMSLSLRAERAGAGSGRVYTITVRATDAAQNYSDANTTVSVPHDQH